LDEVVPLRLDPPGGDVRGKREGVLGIGLVPELEGLVDARYPEAMLPHGRPGLAPLERQEPEPLVLLAVRIEVREDRGERDAGVAVLESPGERQLALVRQRVAGPRVHAGEGLVVVV